MNSKSSISIKRNALEISNGVSTLKRDPNAISKNRLNSISLFLLHPSAILDGTETAALVI